MLLKTLFFAQMALRNILKTSFAHLQRSNFSVSSLIYKSEPVSTKLSLQRPVTTIPSRFSSFRSSENFQKIEKHPEVEVSYDPPEWKYVEELLGQSIIPIPREKAEYPSGWLPPDLAKNKNLAYFVERTRNYMLPVYLEIKFRGHRRLSVVRNIEGDIWKLEEELHELIERKAGKRIYSRINEMNRKIVFKGDYVTLIQKYLMSKGL